MYARLRIQTDSLKHDSSGDLALPLSQLALLISSIALSTLEWLTPSLLTLNNIVLALSKKATPKSPLSHRIRAGEGGHDRGIFPPIRHTV